MKIQQPRKHRAYTDLIVWLCLLSYVGFSFTVDGSLVSKICYPVLYIINFVLCYYLLLWFVFPRFYENQKAKFSLSYLIVIFFFIAFDYCHVKLILPALGGHRFIMDLPISYFIKNSLLNFSFITFTSTSAYLNIKAINRLNQTIELEKRDLSRELYILSDQFNSHLTFNFVNFCYGHLLKISSKAATSFASFTQMLQYSLDNKYDEYISIDSEIEYIQNFIEIQKCLSKNVFVDFNYTGINSECFVVRGILSVLIENAFKHGVSDSKEYPISISLDLKDTELFFSVKNKKEQKGVVLSSGIGLTNLEQVLNLFYPNSHDLEIVNNEYDYFSKLTLKVKQLL